MAKDGGKHVRVSKQRVKTARSRSAASTRWLDRHLNDPFVQQARKDGFRARSAYKLIELNDKFNLFRPGQNIVDLGAAPGGWCQVVKKISPNTSIVAVDLLPIEPIAGVVCLEGDFQDEAVQAELARHLKGKADVILSDMAPNTTGHAGTDHIRIMALLEEAFAFACDHLNEGGAFVAKVFQGGAEAALLAQMKEAFTAVKHSKPKASRAESAEMYVVATGFRKS